MVWFDILRRWLTSDRIRTSPEVGRHLRLQPGQRVIIDERVMVVDRRVERSIAGRPGVSYELHPLGDDAGDDENEEDAGRPPDLSQPPWVWDPGESAERSFAVQWHGDQLRIDCFCDDH